MNDAEPQLAKFPPTRFMGSKRKLLADIWDIASQFQFESAVDLFSGSGVVSYMFKAQGKRVVSNDYMAMASLYARSLVANNRYRLPPSVVEGLLSQRNRSDRFVEQTFPGLYFSDEENRLIDQLRANIRELTNPMHRAIATSALMRACTKKRARGVFTYVGLRYDDGRRDLQIGLEDHFRNAVSAINDAVFDNQKRNHARCGDALRVRRVENALVYIDPPYFSPHSDNEYVRRYHFVEGLARDWEGVDIQTHTVTKKFAGYPTPFSSRSGAATAFDKLFSRFRDNILLVSYSSNSLPTQEEIVEMMSRYKHRVEVHPVDYRYSFGNQGHKVAANNNSVQEYLFVGY